MAKRHIELTTLSLLGKRSEWERFGQHLPEGGVLIVVPKDNPEARRILLKIAEGFRAIGWEVGVHCFSQGATYHPNQSRLRAL